MTARPVAHPFALFLRSSLGRKYLVAAAGAFLAVFVLGHTIGNLQIFLGPEAINLYAWHLHSLPYQLLWVIRAAVLTAVLVHVGFAATLHAGNRRARGRGYAGERYLAATRASRSMMIGGAGILLFLVWHILHFTVRSVADVSAIPPVRLAEVPVPVTNVYAMVYVAFADPRMAALYVVATGLVAAHLSHGVASLFQSLGLSNRVWADRLKRIARLYALFVFAGLASIPLAVQADARLGLSIFDTAALAAALERK